ncbi:Aste57867_21129 [Aphanomyces stellatus]|uniref:Aste57867_21129 protein n=1 Tax=Aphanomyces stellatus TaxID=120398 RepID=A0A485LGT4_9STRA|nr:hypothetical protein As57867_021061 [Aphanomyces stellatus]VFT97803.1 Aste57867_21129 [Aphanomyces stellatus]
MVGEEDMAAFDRVFHVLMHDNPHDIVAGVGAGQIRPEKVDASLLDCRAGARSIRPAKAPPPNVLSKTCHSSWSVSSNFVKLNGNNAYLFPHIKKDKRAREGALVLSPACNISAMVDRIDYERRIETLSDLFDAG